MHKNSFRYILFFLIILFSNKVISQECVYPLDNNPKIKQYINCNQPQKKHLINDSSLMLPFLDDFTNNDIFPNSKNWQDNYVYINNEYCYNPISFGVATFDGLDEKGNLYDHLSSFAPRVADYMTSQPIRLDSVFDGYNMLKLRAQDSVYLSFFIQPANWSTFANIPLPQDSLCLEFYSPVDSTWYHIWSSANFSFYEIDTTQNKGQYFVEVVIPITDEEKFFHDGFMFRFFNYFTLTNNQYPGWQVNGSQWNVDYVYLDRNRRVESFYKDICFVNSANPFLVNYSSMPYNQYCEAPFDEMLDMDKVLISNLDNKPNNVGYNYEVYDSKDNLLKEFQGGASVIEPYFINGYYDNPVTNPAIFPFAFPTNSNVDSAEFLIKHYISSDLGFRQNDTIKYEQKFYNYYAYDDGSPEYSYSLLSTGKSSLAVRFKLNKSDTLRAVNLYFNKILNNEDYMRYNLCVWNDAGSKPGNKVLEQSIKVYNDSLYTADYLTFILDEPLFVGENNFPYLVFYVGLEINQDVNLAFGLDISRNNADNTYYNTTGEWLNSTISGALMIRPLLGKKIPEPHGIDNYTLNNNFSVYPNPVVNANSLVLTSPILSDDFNYIIYNNLGSECKKGLLTHNQSKHQINLDGLNKGIYLIAIYSKAKLVSTVKFIIY
ncbi:MAG: T9SS type A sorting domain-containing protein [Bacteroidales bacterium]|jgi:hypothetical protein